MKAKAKKSNLSAEEIAAVKKDVKRHDKDVGSSEVQAASLTARILHLTQHISNNRNDNHTRRGLIALVNQRRKLLKYLKRKKPDIHAKTIVALGLRK